MEKKKSSDELLLIQMVPTSENEIPNWSLFCRLNLREICPHCGAFHSLYKVNNSDGAQQICCKFDYKKHIKAARKFSGEE